MNLLLYTICIVTMLMTMTKSEVSLSQKCGNEMIEFYLDMAMDMLEKAKMRYLTYMKVEAFLKPADCTEMLLMGFNTSGIYTVWPKSRIMEYKPLEVYCDMDTDGGGWTVIQRRGNYFRAPDYFYKDWESYKNGFGDIERDFWLGNDYIFALTNQKLYSARIDMRDVEGSSRYAQYDTFWIDDENSKYTLHIRDYSGTAGDSLYPKHDNQKFSTKDQKNDNHKDINCAQAFKGGWWYNACHDSNLNGLYHRGKHESHADGVNWKAWKGHKESLDHTEIKIRPKDFKQASDFIRSPTPQ